MLEKIISAAVITFLLSLCQGLGTSPVVTQSVAIQSVPGHLQATSIQTAPLNVR